MVVYLIISFSGVFVTLLCSVLLLLCPVHAWFGREPTNDISVALYSLEFISCSVALKDPWFLWPKILDFIGVSFPCAVVQFCVTGVLSR